MLEQLLISSGLYHSLAPNPKTKIGDAIWGFMASDKNPSVHNEHTHFWVNYNQALDAWETAWSEPSHGEK